MTTHQTSSEQPQRHFVSVPEMQAQPLPDQTDEEIREWAEREIRADKTMLDLLAEL